MKNYSKIFTIIMLVLLVISVGILVAGSVIGFEKNDGQMTDMLLYWTYAMVAIALACIVVVGIIIRAKADAKSLLKLCGAVVGAAVVCGVVYFLSPAAPAVGRPDMDSELTLKLTATILNLTYICAAGAVLAIVVGEIYASRKK